MSLFRKLAPEVVRRYLSGLRFPTLFLLTTILFVASVAIPDALPFVDEILLALAGLLLGRLRGGGADDRGRPDEPGAGSSGGVSE